MRTNRSTVGLRELRTNLEEYISRVDKGESFTVVRHSRPVFRISPVSISEEETGWETLVDFTKIRKAGVPLEEVRSAIQRIVSS